MLDVNIKDEELFLECREITAAVRKPGSGLVVGATQLEPSSEGVVYATGTVMDSLDTNFMYRIKRYDLDSGEERPLTFGPGNDHMPKISPDGGTLAFLSDRKQAGSFQLYFLDLGTGEVRSGPAVDGWVEYLHWSPSGSRLLLGVAGHGADVAGAQGAVTSKRSAADIEDWMPSVETGDETFRARSLWIADPQGDAVQVTLSGRNPWEAVWCGDDALAAIASQGSAEADWYSATVDLLDLASGEVRTIFRPEHQLGWLSAAPGGEHLAVVEGPCSDRTICAGRLRIIKLSDCSIRTPNAFGADITWAEWREDASVHVAGRRRFSAVCGDIDPRTGAETLIYEAVNSHLGAMNKYYPSSRPLPNGRAVAVLEGFTSPPKLCVLGGGDALAVASAYAPGASELTDEIGEARPYTWLAPDGLEIDGWLVTPESEGPFPMLMHVHGGPVWAWNPLWLPSSPMTLMLARRGWAQFWPNPRGSSGRGWEFMLQVYGDMGGADTQDFLSGLDALVSDGIAAPNRIAVTGGSYGGFMTSWLVTQDQRFASAVPVAPVTEWVSQHLTANIPFFDELYLGGEWTDPSGKHVTRSPVRYAHEVRTPTLHICGALDRCTPPTQAFAFHTALRERTETASVLVTYPKEGHGCRTYPAIDDYHSRVVDWVLRHDPGAGAMGEAG